MTTEFLLGCFIVGELLLHWQHYSELRELREEIQAAKEEAEDVRNTAVRAVTIADAVMRTGGRAARFEKPGNGTEGP